MGSFVIEIKKLSSTSVCKSNKIMYRFSLNRGELYDSKQRKTKNTVMESSTQQATNRMFSTQNTRILLNQC